MKIAVIASLVTLLMIFGFAFVGKAKVKKTEDILNSGSTPEGRWPSDRVAQEAEFWTIIEKTRSASSNQEAQAIALRSQLAKLSAADLEKFIGVLDSLMAESYSWDLWGAAYTIHGGASDDAFEDFRKWLISNGQDFFRQANGDPDKLAEMIEASYQGGASFEEFTYIPMEIWSSKTGKKASDLPKDKESLYPPEPLGDPFAEDEDSLSKRYPKLWSRFGKHPLG